MVSQVAHVRLVLHGHDGVSMSLSCYHSRADHEHMLLCWPCSCCYAELLAFSDRIEEFR